MAQKVTGQKKSGFHYAWIILVAVSIIVGVGKGTLNNTAGLFIPAVTQSLGFGVGSFTLYFSVAAIVTLLFLPIGGQIMAKYNAKVVVAIAGLLQAGSLALFGFMSHLWGWYLLAIPMSIGGTIITVIVGPVLINQWFKKHNGLALGILTAAGGLFGAVSSPIVARLIAEHGWAYAYKAIGLFSLVVIVVIALTLLRPAPEQIGLEPLGAEEVVVAEDEDGTEQVVTSEVQVDKKVELKGAGIPVGIARKSVLLPLIAFFFFFSVMIASFSQHIPNHVANLGLSESVGGQAMTYYMIGVLIGALLLGGLVDALGSKMTAIITMVVGIVSMALLLLGTAPFFIFAAAALFGLVGASYGVVAPAMVSTLFGQRDYAQIYSLASLGLAIASIIGLPLYGFIFDLTEKYTLVFIVILVMLVLNILLVLWSFQEQAKLVAEGAWKNEGEQDTEEVSAE